MDTENFKKKYKINERVLKLAELLVEYNIPRGFEITFVCSCLIALKHNIQYVGRNGQDIIFDIVLHLDGSKPNSIYDILLNDEENEEEEVFTTEAMILILDYLNNYVYPIIVDDNEKDMKEKAYIIFKTLSNYFRDDLESVEKTTETFIKS